MLKKELDDLISPCESSDIEFEIINTAYMMSSFCDKSAAAKAWKALFIEDWQTREREKCAPLTIKDVEKLYDKELKKLFIGSTNYYIINGKNVEVDYDWSDRRFLVRVILNVDIHTGRVTWADERFYINKNDGYIYEA